MNKKLGIIADDFTGANDSGVQLAKMGFRTSVGFCLDAMKSVREKDVWVIDTDSRSAEPKEAFHRVLNASKLMLQSGYSHLYKKIDSTLRGNIGTELLAMERVYKPDLIVIVPAFPKMGRITKEGYHYVNGELITESEFGKDPKTPVMDSYIPELLYKQAKKKVSIYTTDMMNETADNFLQRLPLEANWIVCDVKEENEFRIILDKFLQTGLKIIWAGSAGLIEYLPSSLGLKVLKQEEHEYSVGKTLTISGSLSNVTKMQLQEIERMPNTYAIKLDVLQLVKRTIDVETVLYQLQARSEVDHFILYIDSSKRNLHEQLHIPIIEISKLIVNELSELALKICEKIESINGLLLTGGDTAKAICSTIGIVEMELLAEVEPGLPFGKLLGYKREMWAVTKAGGFGTKDSMGYALQFLKGK